MTTTQDIVQKLWSLCDILRDDGITRSCPHTTALLLETGRSGCDRR
ncbi:hypothetical protein ACFL6C_04175 [Myxococcota bacterium]